MKFISLYLVIGLVWSPSWLNNYVMSQPNMMSGLPPQVSMILQNNPRLMMLARQNPIVAQQIMRNPQMLRDPAVLSEFFPPPFLLLHLSLFPNLFLKSLL